MVNYKKHLRQPFYIQKIKDYSLPRAIRLDRIALYFFTLVLEFTILYPIFVLFSYVFTETLKNFMIFLFVPMFVNKFISQYNFHSKTLFSYIKDIVLYIYYFKVRKYKLLGSKFVKDYRESEVIYFEG